MATCQLELHPPKTWTGNALRAHGIGVGVSRQDMKPVICICMVAEDGTIFAHGHLGPEQAQVQSDYLIKAIDTAKNNLVPSVSNNWNVEKAREKYTISDLLVMLLHRVIYGT